MLNLIAEVTANPDVTVEQVGLVGIVVYIVVREVFSYLKTRDSKRDTSVISQRDYRVLMDKVDRLLDYSRTSHDIHNVKDDDGVPVWYVRRSLEKTVLRLADVIESVDKTLNKMSTILDRHSHDLELVHKDLAFVKDKMDHPPKKTKTS